MFIHFIYLASAFNFFDEFTLNKFFVLFFPLLNFLEDFVIKHVLGKI